MFDLPPPDPGVEISVASRGMSKGISQTEGPQMLVRTTLAMGSVQLGGSYKNISSPLADGEAAAFAGLSHQALGAQLSLTAAYKFQTGVSAPTDSDALEFSAAATRKFGSLGARASLVYSPDDLGGTGRSVYWEGGPSLDLRKGTSLSANAGRRERTGAPDYTTFNLGVTQSLHRYFSAELRYFDTAQSRLGEPYSARLVFLIHGRF